MYRIIIQVRLEWHEWQNIIIDSKLESCLTFVWSISSRITFIIMQFLISEDIWWHASIIQVRVLYSDKLWYCPNLHFTASKFSFSHFVHLLCIFICHLSLVICHLLSVTCHLQLVIFPFSRDLARHRLTFCNLHFQFVLLLMGFPINK